VKIVTEKSNLTKDQKDNTNYTQLNLNTNLPTTLPIDLDEIDRKLLQIVQDKFPIVEKPWQKISIQLGISEDEILTRIKRLSETGIIRKIGPIINSPEIGLTAATLIALQVPESKIETVTKIINQYPNVSHNYEREHEYNVWFTIAASSTEKVEEILTEIIQKTGCDKNKILNLPTVKRFKVNVRFQLT
jgi:DNA-binding Lrp family transcriptional regulator